MDTVLLVDDDPDLLNLLGHNLGQAGYRVIEASRGHEGMALLEKEVPGLIVLDLMLPDLSGFEVVELLQTDPRWRLIPVLILSGKDSVQDRIDAFSCGADDFLSKPFSVLELMLRVRSILRRSTAARSLLRSGPFVVDRNSFKCFLRGRQLDLTATEYKLLTVLLEHAGETLMRSSLIEHVWDRAEAAPSRSLDTHMTRLRLKLGHYASAIRTVRNKGYRFIPPPGKTGVIDQ